MTSYIIGSIDQTFYFAGWAVPHSGQGTFHANELYAQPFEFMSIAAMELALLETKDSNARAMNLIIIPVSKKIVDDSAQLSLL